MSSSLQRRPKKLLIITSSGGGGLIQTANAKEQEALAQDPTLQIIRRDFMKDWIPFGEYFANIWNRAQKKGSVSAQQIVCIQGQFFWDFFVFPIIFFCTLYTLFKEDVDQIIDTQPMGTSAIVRALDIFNRKRGKNTRLQKVLVDLPTRKATHFFRPIKKLSPKRRRLVQLTSIVPLLEEGETGEKFWQETCGLSEKEIRYEDAYVRKAFHRFRGKERTRSSVDLKIRFQSPEELRLIETTLQRGSLLPKKEEEALLFSIAPEDRVITILLGSQPAEEATLSYVKKLTELARLFPKRKTHLFVFCGSHSVGQDSLLKKVATFVAESKDHPSHFSVIPFSFQKEDVIAPLFHRSHATCTRSGGQTAMELMAVSTGMIWIHSEAKKNQDLLKGIPGWEAASALYLQKLRGATILTPHTIASHAQGLFAS